MILSPFQARTAAQSSGALVGGATVSFFSQQSGLPVTVYSDREGDNPLGNSVVSGTDPADPVTFARVLVFLPYGEYRVDVTLGGQLLDRIPYVSLPNPLFFQPRGMDLGLLDSGDDLEGLGEPTSEVTGYRWISTSVPDSCPFAGAGYALRMYASEDNERLEVYTRDAAQVFIMTKSDSIWLPTAIVSLNATQVDDFSRTVLDATKAEITLTLRDAEGGTDDLNVEIPAVSSTLAGLMTPAQAEKLDGIAAGATANATNAQLRDRSTHTGTQAIGTVSGLQAALDAKLNANDASVTNSREWTASTVSQAEAEAGTATTRRAWTAQRVRQSILAWWNGSADKTKLDGIAAGAQVNVGTNLGMSGSGNSRSITSSTGNNVNVPVATGSNAGFMATGDKTKLDAVEVYDNFTTGNILVGGSNGGVDDSNRGFTTTHDGGLGDFVTVGFRGLGGRGSAPIHNVSTMDLPGGFVHVPTTSNFTNAFDLPFIANGVILPHNPVTIRQSGIFISAQGASPRMGFIAASTSSNWSPFTELWSFHNLPDPASMGDLVIENLTTDEAYGIFGSHNDSGTAPFPIRKLTQFEICELAGITEFSDDNVIVANGTDGRPTDSGVSFATLYREGNVPLESVRNALVAEFGGEFFDALTGGSFDIGDWANYIVWPALAHDYIDSQVAIGLRWRKNAITGDNIAETAEINGTWDFDLYYQNEGPERRLNGTFTVDSANGAGDTMLANIIPSAHRPDRKWAFPITIDGSVEPAGVGSVWPDGTVYIQNLGALPGDGDVHIFTAHWMVEDYI